jgi:hypothetical protein
LLFSFVIQQLIFFVVVVVVGLAKTAKGYSSLAFELFFFLSSAQTFAGAYVSLLLRCHRQVCQVKVNAYL